MFGCISLSDMDICLVGFNSDIEELNIEYSMDGTLKKISFPPFPTSQYTEYANVFIKIFQIYIPDIVENTFMINHSPCKTMVEIMKKAYVKSKIVFTIHDLSWTSFCLGDVDKFKQIICGKECKSTISKQIFKLYEEERETFKLVDFIVCLSQDTFDLLLSHYHICPQKIFYIPNGISLQEEVCNNVTCKKELRKKYFIGENEKLILFVGRPTIQKGIYALFAALNGVLAMYPDCHLIIAGRISYNEMEKLMKISPSCASRISFLGLLNKECLKEWYIMSDIGVIPSYYEQCTYVGIEMMMYKLPVVASDGFGVQNMFHYNVNAEIAAIENREFGGEKYIQNLTKAIIHLLSHPEIKEKYREAGWNLFQQRFELKQMKKGYQRLFSML